jgi:hypothetical protein
VLKHADNRRTAAILWAGGLSAAEIATVIDDDSAAGEAAVRAAVALFLHERDPATPWRIDDPDSYQPVRRALLPVTAHAAPTPTPAPAPVPAAIPTTPKPSAPVTRLRTVIHPPHMLRTDAGRAAAARLWAIDDLPLREVSRRFGTLDVDPKTAAVPAWKAINEYLCRQLGVNRIAESGQARKQLVRRLLLQAAPAAGAAP